MQRCSMLAKKAYDVYLLDLGYDRALRTKDAQPRAAGRDKRMCLTAGKLHAKADGQR